MSTVYIGIDLAAKTCVAAVRSEEGELVCVREFPTSQKSLVALMQGVEGEAVEG